MKNKRETSNKKRMKNSYFALMNDLQRKRVRVLGIFFFFSWKSTIFVTKCIKVLKKKKWILQYYFYWYTMGKLCLFPQSEIDVSLKLITFFFSFSVCECISFTQNCFLYPDGIMRLYFIHLKDFSLLFFFFYGNERKRYVGTWQSHSDIFLDILLM